MSSLTIAIPSEQPGGLEAQLGAHFGHCEIYTLVDVEDGTCNNVRVIPNVPHQQGGCMAPVQHLASQGVQVLIAGGMGMRPLMGFNQMGIQVYLGAGAPSIGAAVDAFLQGDLLAFGTHNTCGGGEHHCGS